MAVTHFDTNFNVGDSGVIFTGALPEIAQATITALDFREGFNPLFFIADDDIIFTTNVYGPDGSTFVKVPQGKFFATVALLKAYIDGLGL